MLFGDYTLLLAAFTNLAGGFESIVDFAAQFKDLHEQNDMLREYLDDKSIFGTGEKNTREVTGKLHTIEFRNVSFAYPRTEKKVLHNLNMTISEGKTYGLVGLNGSGKSTLVNLLLRLYEPTSGEILLNGISIKEYNLRSYYEAIACVFQNTTKYAMPIKDYIASGKKCDMKKAENAILQVKLNDWCSELPHGFDTMLTRAFSSESDSVEPSIGQWQKLSIARAIYKDSPIMILDEPSASLDVDSENEIFNYIARLAARKTAILISHRLSNILECDYIYLLRDGQIVEEGTHHVLMAQDGIYAELFKSQAKYYQNA
jgi:ABC-type multidrug transport system fused ATPase/permease subunit